ncbi:PilN domain-containing protein [Vibrio brasiliensis]
MLYNVNLLPWREWRRHQQKQRLKWLVNSGVMVALAIQGWAGIYIDHQIDIKLSHLALLNSELAQTKQQQGELDNVRRELNNVRGHHEALAELKQRTDSVVQFIESLPVYIPLRVYLVSLQMVGNKIEMVAISREIANIRALLDSLENCLRCQQIRIHSITNDSYFSGLLYHKAELSFSLDGSEGLPNG